MVEEIIGAVVELLLLFFFLIEILNWQVRP